MKIPEIFGLPKVNKDKVRPKEVPVLSLVGKAGGEQKVFMVAEPVTFVGSETPNFEQGEKYFVIKPGDEVMMFDYRSFDQRQDEFFAAMAGQELIPRVQVNIHNAENIEIGTGFYINKRSLENKKIKIDTAAKPKYS